MYTYQDLIRKYSDDVDRGLADTDLTARQRRLVVVALNTESNDYRNEVAYPPADGRRDESIRHLADTLWNVRPFLFAVAPRALDTDIDVAHNRAVDILRNL